MLFSYTWSSSKNTLLFNKFFDFLNFLFFIKFLHFSSFIPPPYPLKSSHFYAHSTINLNFDPRKLTFFYTYYTKITKIPTNFKNILDNSFLICYIISTVKSACYITFTNFNYVMKIFDLHLIFHVFQ